MNEKKPSVLGKIITALGCGIVFGAAASATIFLMFSMDRNGQIQIKNPKETIEELVGAKEVSSSEEATIDDAEDIAEVIEELDEETETDEIASGTTRVIDVADVVDDVMPSVVSITGDFTVTSQDFFGQTYSQTTPGSGSGIIIGQTDDDLLIATNNHVVADGSNLQVQFIDGSTAGARVKGTNESNDLAVIMVDLDDIDDSTEKAITVAKLGDSDSIKVGETAIAIGNSLGYGQSVTLGVISALDRELTMSDGAVSKGLIQTDAAINPGNSGGALVNIKGEVIGINSSKIGGATVDGVGFAIPVSAAQPILSDIVTSSERVKVSDSKAGYLGIGGATVTADVSQMYGMPVGVALRQVYAGTGAERAGLEQGDIITSLNGRIISSMDELREELCYYEKGEFVTVEVYRMVDGEYTVKSFKVELIGKDDLENASAASKQTP